MQQGISLLRGFQTVTLHPRGGLGLPKSGFKVYSRYNNNGMLRYVEREDQTRDERREDQLTGSQG